MNPTKHDMPSFRDWPTSRLEFMLNEHEESLAAIQATESGADKQVYRNWITAIRAELFHRGY